MNDMNCAQVSAISAVSSGAHLTREDLANEKGQSFDEFLRDLEDKQGE